MDKMVKFVFLLLLLDLFSLTLQKSEHKELTIPVSSPIQLECDDDLKVNNIEVTIRRSNMTCLTTSEDCTLPIHIIETIKNECNKQTSCEVDISDITNNRSCMNDYGFLNVWYTCKTILRLSCDFEDDWCNWVPGYSHKRFIWKRGLLNTIVDHTTASSVGKYAYMYQNSPSRGAIAELESVYIIPTEQQCLSFWYFTSNYKDSVYVYQNKNMLLNLSDHRRDKWLYFQIPLKSYSSYKLVFTVVRRSWWTGYKGAIAIDDILIENKKCNSFLFQCDFDTNSNSCNFKRQYSHQYEWVRQTGHWLNNGGPRYDHSTTSDFGYYLYLKKKLYTANGTSVYLKLPNIHVIILRDSCFTFWYYIHGDKIGGLNVTIDDRLVWTRCADQDYKWKKGTVELHKGTVTTVSFIGIVGNNWKGDIAIDDLYITEGACTGLFDQNEICADVEFIKSKETFCPKGYLELQNTRILFEPEREECSDIYYQTKQRLLTDCENVADSHTCLFDPSTDIRSQPECFQLYEYRIQHTCDDEETTTSNIHSRGDSSTDEETTTSIIHSSRDLSTVQTVLKTSNESATGLVVGFGIGGFFLICILIVFVIFLRRRILMNRPIEKRRNSLKENDYVGSQDIALPQTNNSLGQIQNDVSRQTSGLGFDSKNTNAEIHNVIEENEQVSAYAVCQNTTLTNSQTLNDNEYSIVIKTAETSFTMTKLPNTPSDYKFAKTIQNTGNKIRDEDQYALSEEGVYDHSGNNRHKELEDNIYNHAVDNIYDNGSHKRNDEGKEDTYDHFFGQKTEDDYDITTTT